MYIKGGGILLIRIGLFLVILFILVGCSLKTSTETVTDKNTTPDVSTIESISPKILTYHHKYDNMDRGSHNYSDKTLVVDPEIEKSKICRGNVIFFNTEKGTKEISRIVALPGEKIKITKGQIYINDKKLDTFYGFAHRLGLNKDNYFESMDKSGNLYNKKEMKKLFETNMNEQKLADNEYYFVDDDWLRGTMGVLKENNIIGLVLGYK